MRFTLEDLAHKPELQKRNPFLQQPLPTPPAHPAPGETEKGFAGAEPELQRLCERWLIQRGYGRRTPKEIAKATPARGWFIHMHQARGNPIILDLLILSHTGCFLEVELKTARGKITPEQIELVEREGKPLCRGFTQFAETVMQWETATASQNMETQN